MEDPVKDQQPTPDVNSSSGKTRLQRYPLRSSSKTKEDKAPVDESSVVRRGRSAANVSKSVGVLDLSGKEKSASSRPPRRLSTPAKSAVNLVRKTTGNITPISEKRSKRSATQGKTETPVSDVSRLSSRKKFNVLSSASYWLNQIKLSESAAKHNISLGFFKLALEAGCEQVQRMRDELKAYAGRHNLAENGEIVKQLFESYNVPESLEQLQVSETFSQMPEDGNRSSDDDIHSTSSTVDSRKLKPKSLNIDTAEASKGKELGKETKHKFSPASRTRGTINKNSTTPGSVRSVGGLKPQKNVQKVKKEADKVMDKSKSVKKSAVSQDAANTSPVANPTQADKENADTPRDQEIASTEVM